jgi:DNA primase
LMLAGITGVVAPLGTALTEQQAALIRKYTKNVFLLYDSDQAGLKATFRSGDELLAAGVSAQVITLPDGEDPDTYVNKTGAEGFERAAKDAVDVFERRIQILERNGWFGDLTKKRAAIDKLTPTIRVTNDPILKDLYIARTAEVAGVTRETIERDLQTAPRERRVPRETGGPPPAEAPSEAPVRQRERRVDHRAIAYRAERELVRMLLHQRRFIDTVAERIGPDHFADPAYRAIFSELTVHDHDAPVDQIAAGLDEDATEVLQDLMNENGGLDRAEEGIEGSIKQLLAREPADRLNEIDRLMPIADGEMKDQLLMEKKELAAEMRALRPRWKGFNSNH